jgi:hypothetical protein
MNKWICALSLLLAFSADLQAQHRIEADEESLARGIAAYTLQREGKIVTVMTEDSTGTATGRYVLEFDTPKGIAVRFEDLGTALEMYWNPMNAEFQLSDLKTGQQSSARPGLTAEGKPFFEKSDGEGLMSRHEQGTARAFFVLHQTMVNMGLYNQGEAKPRAFEQPVTPQKPLEPEDGLLVNLCPPSCTGGLLHSGFFVNSASSLCCDNAYFYLQGLCWNQYCVGCCRTLPCDSACLVGDGFGCICSHRGQSCGPPLEQSCGDDWPPECT